MLNFLFPEPHLEKIRARKSTHRRIAVWMWRLAGVGILLIIGFFVFLSFQDLPTFEELENPKSNLASEVYASEGALLGRYYFENRVPVDFEQLNPHIVKALIATEDERYYKHSGIDAEALGRVFFRTVILGNPSSGGGSTITQQLAKLLYSSRNFSGMNQLQKAFTLLSRKFKEWITAVKLERSYTKEEIMSMYLNQFDFIYGAYGIEAAAETYFGKKQDSLKVEEAAMLVGMLKNPALYNPIKFPETALQRREVVLFQMKKSQHINQEQYDSLRTLPLDAGLTRQNHVTGPAPYFRMELRERLKSVLENEADRKPDGTSYNLYADGLKIYTTIDLNYQEQLEAAVLQHMPVVQKRFWRRWKNKDPWTYKDHETSDANLRARELTLERLIRESDRYQRLREKYLGQGIAAIEKAENISLGDDDLERLWKESQEEGSLGKLVSQKLISTEQASNYRRILRSPAWSELGQQWQAFQEAVEEAFNTPVKMTVFAYTDNFSKDTVMTPLDSIKYLRNFMQVGSVAIDPLTGHIKAWVGGLNYKWFQYDHVTTDRQVGSTFKPFVYATAINQQKISPCFEVQDIPYTIHTSEGQFNLSKDWTPENATGEYSYNSYSLKDGLRKSKNTVSVYLMKQLANVEPVRDIASNMGLSKEKIPPVPSICLGAAELNVLEMTGAYCTFANRGFYNEPAFIDRIEDRNGKVIYNADKSNRVTEQQALEEPANYAMVEMLRYASGTMGLYSQAGGKTGTTNDYVDGWFVGITPSLVVGTWVGGEHNWIRFRSLANGQGSVMAKPIFVKFMQSLEKDPDSGFKKGQTFSPPPPDMDIELDCSEYETVHTGDNPDSENENFGDGLFGDEIQSEEDTLLPKGYDLDNLLRDED